MKKYLFFAAAALFALTVIHAADNADAVKPVPVFTELEQLVPEAKGYVLIAKLDPRRCYAGYTSDISGVISGKLEKIGYLLKVTEKNGTKSFVFTAMDPFDDDLVNMMIPSPGSPIQQKYVNNLEVYTNSKHLVPGKFAKGNVEIWPGNYGGANTMKIPGATGRFDFGDAPGQGKGYGCFQIHNFEKKQTVFAVNHLFSAPCDLGIGNMHKDRVGNVKNINPDWTFAKNADSYTEAELCIVGKFDKPMQRPVVKIDFHANTLVGKADRKKALYSPGEKMTFTITPDFGGKKPTDPCFITWTRTGDDGKVEKGKAPADPEKPVVITTSMDKPGFVRILAYLEDLAGRRKQYHSGKRMTPVFFDGGAGVDIDKLQGIPEPEDFDAFWEKQKARLAAVPIKAELKKIDHPNKKFRAKVNMYMVSVDCAGPRPVTGFLTIPVNAKPKSLGAKVCFRGYNADEQIPPSRQDDKYIVFDINAHGMKLGQDAKYYEDFKASISTGGKSYAFDPNLNKDPETAYFNGMALRVMRAVQYVQTLPEWNGKQLIATGGSQGGLQTMWAIGLCPEVTEAYPSIPWCCDLGGRTIGRIKPPWTMQYFRALDYYDPINHAKRVKKNASVNITRAGLGDYVCPPSGVAVLYNNLNCRKKIRWVQGSTHGFEPKNPQDFYLEQN